MSLIQITDVTFGYDTSYDSIFEHMSVQLDTEWKLGFIGRNGKGKTTLLKLMMGAFDYQGAIVSDVTFDYFPFEISNRDTNTIEILKENIAPFREWERIMKECETQEERLEEYGVVLELYLQHDGYIIEELLEKELGKMGLSAELLHRPFRTLSNGEQTKAMLAALFLKKNNFLLIDEPTNHLDLEGRALVAQYLKSQKKGYILVSHDRNFLNQTIDHVLSLNRQSIEVLKGNYDSWQFQKDRRDDAELAQNETLKKDIKRLSEAARRTANWSDQIESSKIGSHLGDRGFVGHQAAKMMQKAKNTERRQGRAMEEKKNLLKDIEEEQDLKLNRLPWPNKNLIEAEDLTIWYENGPIFQPVSFTVRPGERVAITGTNGCGKSSLLKFILGESLASDGRFILGNACIISYVSQDTSHLKGSLNDYAKAHDLDETIFKTVLRQLDFNRVQFEKPMETYSGGQKKKVLLARSLAQPAHLFLWDEPLNFVDILSRIQLERLLLRYQPTMLFVEHDGMFLQHIATKTINLMPVACNCSEN